MRCVVAWVWGHWADCVIWVKGQGWSLENESPREARNCLDMRWKVCWSGFLSESVSELFPLGFFICKVGFNKVLLTSQGLGKWKALSHFSLCYLLMHFCSDAEVGNLGMNTKCQVSAGICSDAFSLSCYPYLHFQVSSLPTLFAAEGKFSFLSASPKHILPEFVGGWQSTKIESRAGGLSTSEWKCFHVPPLVNHDYVCGSSMTEQRGSKLQVF